MVDHPHSLLCIAYAEDNHIEDGGDKVGVLDMPNPYRSDMGSIFIKIILLNQYQYISKSTLIFSLPNGE